MDAGAIAGIVIGVLIVIAFGIFDGFIYFKVRKEAARVNEVQTLGDFRHNLYGRGAADIERRISTIGTTTQQALDTLRQALMPAHAQANQAQQVQQGHPNAAYHQQMEEAEALALIHQHDANHQLALQLQAGHEPHHRRASSRKRSQHRRSRKHRQRI